MGSNTQPKSSSGNLTPKFSAASTKAKLASKLGATGLGAAGGTLLAGLKATQVACKVIQSAGNRFLTFYERETGDYGKSMQFSNFWQEMLNINPLTQPSMAINYINYRRDTKIANKRTTEERELLGDTFVNSSVRKV